VKAAVIKVSVFSIGLHKISPFMVWLKAVHQPRINEVYCGWYVI
jgi:hypothetical protein